MKLDNISRACYYNVHMHKLKDGGNRVAEA